MDISSLLVSPPLRPLIHHQLEMHRATSLVSVVDYIFCPGLALDVDQHTSCKTMQIQVIIEAIGIEWYSYLQFQIWVISDNYVLDFRRRQPRVGWGIPVCSWTGSRILGNRGVGCTEWGQCFPHPLDFHPRMTPKLCQWLLDCGSSHLQCELSTRSACCLANGLFRCKNLAASWRSEIMIF